MERGEVISMSGRRVRVVRRRDVERETYTVAEVGTMLGISLTGTYAHRRDGLIPGRRLCARWVVPRRPFDARLDGVVVEVDSDAELPSQTEVY
jgi:hypothetical protein